MYSKFTEWQVVPCGFAPHICPRWTRYCCKAFLLISHVFHFFSHPPSPISPLGPSCKFSIEGGCCFLENIWFKSKIRVLSSTLLFAPDQRPHLLLCRLNQLNRALNRMPCGSNVHRQPSVHIVPVYHPLLPRQLGLKQSRAPRQRSLQRHTEPRPAKFSRMHASDVLPVHQRQRSLL